MLMLLFVSESCSVLRDGVLSLLWECNGRAVRGPSRCYVKCGYDNAVVAAGSAHLFIEFHHDTNWNVESCEWNQ
jgi:hypothetical protein